MRTILKHYPCVCMKNINKPYGFFEFIKEIFKLPFVYLRCRKNGHTWQLEYDKARPLAWPLVGLGFYTCPTCESSVLVDGVTEENAHEPFVTTDMGFLKYDRNMSILWWIFTILLVVGIVLVLLGL